MKRLPIIIVTVALLAAAGYGVYQLGMNRGMQMTPTPAVAPATKDKPEPANTHATTEKRVLYWHDPMVPGQKFDKPGKSPFMDMELVPVYADAESDNGNVAISPRMQQNLGVRTAEVTTATLTQKLEAAGSIAYN